MRFLRVIAFGMLFLGPLLLHAQDGRIILTLEDIPVSDALKSIRQQADVPLAYDARGLKRIRVTGELVTDDVEVALRFVLRDTPFTFESRGGTYLILPDFSPPEPEGRLRRDITVIGQVLDAESRTPLPFAGLSIKDMSQGVTSGLDGRFFYAGIPVDTLELCVSYLGYRSVCRSLRGIPEDGRLTFMMERNSTFLPAVDIIGEQPFGLQWVERQEALELDPELLRSLSSNGQADPFKYAQLLPGVGSNDELDGRLYIRGADNDENLVLWDGFTVYHLNHFFGVISTFNAKAVQNIRLHKGNYSSRYGGRTGGVLNVTGRVGDRQRARAELGMDLISNDVTLETPIGKRHSLLLAFRRSHTDYLESYLYTDLLDRIYNQSLVDDPSVLLEEQTDDPTLSFHDLNLKWTTDLGERDQISFTFFNGRDRFDNITRNTYSQANGGPREFNDIFLDDASWGTNGFGLVWTHSGQNGRSSFTSLGGGQYRSTYFFGEEERDFINETPLPVRRTTDVQTNTLQDLTLTHRRVVPMESGQLEFGYQYSRLSITDEGTERLLLEGITRIADSTDVSDNHSVFLERSWQRNRWSWRPGVRATVNSFTDRLYWEPRFRLDYSAADNVQLRLSAGNYIQTIRRVAENNIFLRQADQWSLSDGDAIPGSRSFQFALGADWTNSGWRVDGEVYAKRLKGVLLNLEQTRLLNIFTTAQDQLVFGDGEVYGIDILVQRKWREHDLWLAYSYAHSRNTFESVNEGEAIPDAFNKPNDLKLVYAFHSGDYVFTSSIFYSNGYPYTPLIGVFQINEQEFVQYGSDLSARLPDIFRWDVNVGRTFRFPRMEVTLNAGIHNLTDRDNIRARLYQVDTFRPQDSDDLTISTVDLELLGITPNFSCNIAFK